MDHYHSYDQADKATETRKKNAVSQKQYRERKKAQEQAMANENLELKLEIQRLRLLLAQKDVQSGDVLMNQLHHLMAQGDLNTSYEWGSETLCNNDSTFGLPIAISPSQSPVISPSNSWNNHQGINAAFTAPIQPGSFFHSGYKP